MADATRRVSVRLSLDDAARVKQELRVRLRYPTVHEGIAAALTWQEQRHVR